MFYRENKYIIIEQAQCFVANKKTCQWATEILIIIFEIMSSQHQFTRKIEKHKLIKTKSMGIVH